LVLNERANENNGEYINSQSSCRVQNGDHKSNYDIREELGITDVNKIRETLKVMTRQFGQNGDQICSLNIRRKVENATYFQQKTQAGYFASL
jgi:hypothetical protein